MTLGWILDVDQLALLDQSDKLAATYLSPAYERVREVYGTVGLDVPIFVASLRELALRGRELRAGRDNAAERYSVESSLATSAAVTDEGIDGLVDALRAAVELAEVRRHPQALFLREELLSNAQTNNRRNSQETITRMLDVLRRNPQYVRSLHLPRDFVDEAERRLQTLRDKGDKASEEHALSSELTDELHEVLDEIRQHYEELVAARKLAVLISGEDLPEVDLSFLRAAAAPVAPRVVATAKPAGIPGLNGL